MIRRFDGEFSFLSNFYEHTIYGLDGSAYKTNEHYFQAHKALTPEEHELVRYAPTARSAKLAGRRVQLRPDWEAVKFGVMRAAITAKFTPYKEPGRRLILTAPNRLVEGNTWGDRFWGVDGTGENWLGVLLMARRAELLDGAL